MDIDGNSRKESRNLLRTSPISLWQRVQLSATERKLLDSKASSTEWDCAQKAGGVPRCRVPRFVEACALLGEHTSDNEWQRVTTSDNEWQRVTTSDNEWQCGWEIVFRILMFNKGIWMIWFKPAGILYYKSCVKSLILQVSCQSLQVWRKNEESRRRSKNVEQRLKRKGGQLTMLPLRHCVHSNTMLLWILPCDSNTEAIGRRAETPCRRRAAKCQVPAMEHVGTNSLFHVAMPLCQAKSCIQDIYLKT